MSDLEFTYSSSEENQEDSFIIDKNVLTNALSSTHLLLNEEENEDHNYDDNNENDENINENNDKNNNENDDDNEDIYIKIEDISTHCSNSTPLTSCAILDIFEGEIKRCSSKINL